MISRFIFSLLLAITLIVLTSTQENTTIPGSPPEVSLEGESNVPDEPTSGQEAVNEAEEMDQLILAIEDSSSGSSETTQGSETTDVAEGADQSTQESEDDSSVAPEGDKGDGTIKEAEEIDQLIQVLVQDDDGSENAKVDSDAIAAGKNEATNQSIGAPGEESSKVLSEVDKETKTFNQTESMDQLIQMLADTESNSRSENIQDLKSVNQTEPVKPQSMQMLVDDVAIVDTALQVPIQGMTEMMNQMIQTLVNNESSTGTKTSQNAEIIKETDSMNQLVQALEDEEDSAEGNDEAASGQNLEIIEKEDSMDRMILALESGGI